MTTSTRTEVWAKIYADEDGLVSIGKGKQVTLDDLQQALAATLGSDSVTGIFGGQFRFKMEVPLPADSDQEPQTKA